MEANGQILSGPHTPSTNRYMVEWTGRTATLYKVVVKGEKIPVSSRNQDSLPFWLIHPQLKKF